jgi:hypothetical protein
VGQQPETAVEVPEDLRNGELDGKSTFTKVKTSSDTWEYVPSNEVMALIDKIRAERKLALDGGVSVGPARQPKSNEARKAGPGKPRDMLVDSLVVGVEEPKKLGGERRQVVYCIGCKKRTEGRDPNRIKQHGKDCTVRYPGIFLVQVFQ